MDEVTAIVLAGGRSRRMGRDKAAIVLGGRTLLQRVVDAASEVAGHIVVVGAPGRPLPDLTSVRPIAVVRDPVEDEGPLAGIIAGLRAAAQPIALIVACDHPFVRPALLDFAVAHARQHPAVLPVVDGEPHPLFAAVRRDALAALEAAFAAGGRRAMVIADLPGAALLPPELWRPADPDGRSFIGVNSPEQLACAEELLATFEV